MNKQTDFSPTAGNLVVSAKTEFRDRQANEPEWLYSFRKEGWMRYNEMPLPGRVTNLWRYSDPRLFLVKSDSDLMNLPLGDDRNERGDAEEIDPELAGYGRNFADRSSIFILQPQYRRLGIVFSELSRVALTNPHLVDEYLGRLVGADFGKFEAFNAAVWNVGAFVFIPDNVIIDKPFYILRHPAGPATVTRLLVVIGKNSEATIIDDYNCHCRHEGEILNNVVELFAGPNAAVNYVQVQRLGPEARIHTTERLALDSEARGRSIFVSVGGHAAKINAGTVLQGKGAESRIYGIAFADSDQKFDHHTYHHHRAPNTYSDIDFKVMLKQKAASAYTGLIRIERDAPNCEAYQENRNLLLNEGTKAESIPELEILNDQVRCTHGATMGPVDPEMIFYLRSRGYSERQAVSSIVHGFVEPTLSKMQANIANVARELIYHKMQEG